MLTRMLWEGLNTPYTRHPLFWRTVYRGGGTQFATRNRKIGNALEWISISYVIMTVALWLILNLIGPGWRHNMIDLMFCILSLPVGVGVLLLLRFTLLKGTITGIMWAFNVSIAITTELEQHRYALLTVSPPGALGASWAICTGYLYRSGAFNRYITQRGYTVTVTALVTPLLIFTRPFTSEEGTMLMLISAVTLIVAFYIDSIHSPVLASLVGILIPRYSRNQFETRIGTAVIFLLLQVLTFMFTLLAALSIFPRFYITLQFSGFWANASIPVLCLLVFFLVREVIIIGLWRIFIWELNTGPDELGIFSNQVV